VNLLDESALCQRETGDRNVCVVVFANDEMELVSAHMIPAQSWHRKRNNRLHYKSFSLNTDATPVLSRQLLRDNFAMLVEDAVPSTVSTGRSIVAQHPQRQMLLPLCHFFLLSLEQENQTPTQTASMAVYRQYILDAVLLLRHFPRRQLLQDCLMADQRLEGRAPTLLTFLKQTALFVPLQKLWLETEMLFFRHCCEERYECCDMTQLQQFLRQHVCVLLDAVPQQAQKWRDLLLPVTDDPEGCWWQQDAETGLYRVKFEWLLKAGPQLSLQQFCWGGCVDVTEGQFYKHLLPVLYRELLGDFLCYFQWWQQQHQHNVSECPLPENLDSQESCQQFTQKWGVEGSAVMQEFVTRCNQLRTRSQQGSSALHELVNRASLPDIEDMCRQNVLPPCLQTILVKQHQLQTPLKNRDRLNGVMYLSDMGYSQDETQRYLLRHSVKDDVPQQLEHNHKKWEQLRQKDPEKTYVSLNCNAVMNLNNDGADRDCLLRCPYEQQKHGERRQRSTQSEQIQCRSECYAALGCESDMLANGYDAVWHPLQYMNIALNKRKGHVK
jgi:hypothetical protein